MGDDRDQMMSSSYARALRKMTERYENLVQVLGMLRQMDQLDAPDAQLDQMTRDVLQVIAQGLAAENCSLMMVSATDQAIELRAACGFWESHGASYEAGKWTGKRFRVGEGIVGRVAETHEAIRVDDVQTTPDFTPLKDSPVAIRSLLCFPLLTDGELIGVLNLSHSRPSFFSSESERMLSLVAERAARIFRTHLLRSQVYNSELYYRLVTDNAGDAILVVDPAGRVVSVNPALAAITATGGTEWLETLEQWEAGIHPEDRDRYRTHRRMLTQTPGARTISYRYIDYKEEPHHIEERAAPMRDRHGAFSGVVSVLRDVTERALADQELACYRDHLKDLVAERTAELERTNAELEHEIRERREVEQHLRRLAVVIEQSTESVCILRPDGVIEYVNPAFERLSDTPREDLLAHQIGEIVRPDYDDSARQALRDALQGDAVWRGHLSSRDGSSYEEDCLICPVRDASGAVRSFVKLGRDVTRESRLHKRLIQAEKMEAIGRLAGGIAHDFNNILYAVLGFANLAADELDPGGKPRKYIDKVLEAGLRAQHLVEQIQTASNRQPLRKTPVRLEAIVQEVVELLQASCPPSIEIRTHLDSDAGHILADPTQLHQIVMNLCTNAYQAMIETGGVMDIEVVDLCEPVITENYPELGSDRAVYLTVSDTGSGMDEATLARIFEPYFTTRQATTGTGLGLSTVRGIVKAHNGVVMVESEPGRGTVMHVLLPAYQPKGDDELDDVPCATPQPSDDSHETATVMVVDDEEPVLLIASDTLGRLGYTVRTFLEPYAALDHFKQQSQCFDVVVLDQMMPGLKGTELAKRINAVRPETPVILCTGFSQGVRQCDIQGINLTKVLLKPVAALELAQAVRAALSSPSPADLSQYP